jgi:hypothetical protein
MCVQLVPTLIALQAATVAVRIGAPIESVETPETKVLVVVLVWIMRQARNVKYPCSSTTPPPLHPTQQTQHTQHTQALQPTAAAVIVMVMVIVIASWQAPDAW